MKVQLGESQLRLVKNLLNIVLENPISSDPITLMLFIVNISNDADQLYRSNDNQPAVVTQIIDKH